MTSVKPFIPINFQYRCSDYYSKRRMNQRLVKQSVIKIFYEYSTKAPGKKECIVQNKIRKQKRYLNNSLKFLHRKFCEVNPFVVSFCKLRPYWFVLRNVHARDNCLCVKHANIEMVFERLKYKYSFNEQSEPYSTVKSEYKILDDLIEGEMLCSVQTENCMFRKCLLCLENGVQFLE